MASCQVTSGFAMRRLSLTASPKRCKLPFTYPSISSFFTSTMNIRCRDIGLPCWLLSSSKIFSFMSLRIAKETSCCSPGSDQWNPKIFHTCQARMEVKNKWASQRKNIIAYRGPRKDGHNVRQHFVDHLQEAHHIFEDGYLSPIPWNKPPPTRTLQATNANNR